MDRSERVRRAGDENRSILFSSRRVSFGLTSIPGVQVGNATERNSRVHSRDGGNARNALDEPCAYCRAAKRRDSPRAVANTYVDFGRAMLRHVKRDGTVLIPRRD